MNLRILKKLSKRAAPLLSALGDDRDQFRADKCESYTSIRGHDFKHWERDYSVHADQSRGVIKYRPKHDRSWVTIREPAHPLKGTLMVGCMSGYYEPEWEEQTAWESLCSIVFDHFTEWTETGPIWAYKGKLDTPTRVLQAAREVIAITTSNARGARGVKHG